MKIFVCGDVVNLKSNNKICTSEVEAVIKSCDYAICNFEAPIKSKGKKVKKIGPNIAQLEVTPSILKSHGFDLCLLANNHMLDFGEIGLKKTMDEIKRVGMEYCGAGLNLEEAYSVKYVQKNNITIAIVNVAENHHGALDNVRKEKFGYAWVSSPNLPKIINVAKSKSDFVLIMVHAGLEGYTTPQSYWREVYRNMCDLGADFVIGSHPHVPQGIESYEESNIIYSLGNFYFDKGEKYRDNESYSIVINFKSKLDYTIDIIYHSLSDGIVSRVKEPKSFKLKELSEHLYNSCSLLEDKMHSDITPLLNKWSRYSKSKWLYDGGLYTTLRRVISKLLGREILDKELLKSHLRMNESYYFALSSQNKKNEK
ncbi:CapA family protein [Enterovibrio baiacu]|uniref:CapA family protein n=1 Tax=Enterovibrio baiacu TaxID=2491023 RepID=UPI001012DC99|nr:CapA family protein [Enterovibrio baiacu]MBE1274992.1 CapA family protein [Enterovibrio baiacu]